MHTHTSLEITIMSDSNSLDMPATADEIVAKRIIDRLVTVGLLPQKYAQYTQQKLTAGDIKADSWRRLAAKALEIEDAGGDHGQ